MFTKIKICVCVILMFLAVNGCKKYLDQKPDKSMVIPGNLKDLQALQDYYLTINLGDPCAGEASCDNYFLTDADWNNLTEYYRRMYTWEKDFIFSPYPNMWSSAYNVVFITNSILDNLPGIERTVENRQEWDNIKGQALFTRASEFHKIACTWALTYDSLTSKNELGIPLRLSSDFNEKSMRSNLETTYGRIIEDLKQSISLLPSAPVRAYRASKPAAYGMLARVYLSMGKYYLAGKYADSCLSIYNELMDYNSLNATSTWPISELNSETIFYNAASNPSMLSNVRAKIDSVLYSSYDSNDLRKTVFFKNNNNGTYGFKGNYTGHSALFTGIATDEIYLVKGECLAREGNYEAAMVNLRALLVKRWKSGTFVPLIASSATEALDIILKERRKELIYRDLRWMDIKRLNREGANIVLKKMIKGDTLIFRPNDLRYALAIPEDIITITGIQQNPR